MGWIEKVSKMIFDKKGSAPGKTVIVQTVAAGDQERTTEFYQLPGIASGPSKNDVVVVVPVGTGVRVAVASHNYQLGIKVTEGERIFYSTNAAGDTIKAQINLDPQGKISIKNETKSLATLISDLIDEIKNIQTMGSPANHTLNPVSQVALELVKTNIKQLLKD